MPRIRRDETPFERATRENALAAAVKAMAYLDYNIMMGHVEDPEEEEEDNERA